MSAILRYKGFYSSSFDAVRKTNLRFLPLTAENDRWTPWRCSDCFYPEMIPEPDYSDTGDESDDEAGTSLPSSTTSAFESLRDMTEVYVTSVEQKKKAPAQRKPASKRGGPSPKTSPKGTTKVVANVTTEGKTSPPKRSPKSPTKTTKASQNLEVKASKTKAATTKKGTLSEDSKKKDETKSKTEEKESPLSQTKTVPTKTSPGAVRKASPTSPTKSKAKAKQAAALKPKPDTEIAAGDAKTTASTKKPKETSQRKTPEPPKTSTSSDKSQSLASTPVSTEPSSDEEQLIKPKKPVNPYLQSSERQKLHKELKFSQKYGKLGASQKTELELALQRYTENRERRELLAGEKSSLEQILELQARKIEMQEKMDKHPAWMERLQRPPSATWSDPRTDEFYRVHARVVSSNLLTHCFLPNDEESDFSSPRKLSSDSASDG